MKEILVLCLTRFGDLIQITPLLRGLRQHHPEARVTLAALKGFSGVLPLIRGYDRVFLFDKDEAARKISDIKNPLAAYRHMDSFIRTLEDDCYDLIINLTCDRMSAYVASALNAVSISGITATVDDQRYVGGMWGSHLFSAMQGSNRKLNRINLVDIFTQMGGLKPDGLPVELHETEDGRQFATQFFRDESLEDKTVIGIQLGASEPIRCWPSESFAELADRLSVNPDYRIILFGSPAERELAHNTVAAMKSIPVNAVGRTDIEQLFSLVRRCSVLVTNDTGTMHFAAAAGTKVVMLSVGPAYFFCTGPYSDGNIALQPQLPCSPCLYNQKCHTPVCRTKISVETVYKACNLLLKSGESHGEDFPGVDVYLSRFGYDGFLTWQKFGRTVYPSEELAIRYEEFWKSSLHLPMTDNPVDHPPLSPELVELASQGIAVTNRIIEALENNPVPVDRLTALGDQEAEIERQIKLLGSRHQVLAPLVDYLILMRENITGDDIHSIARQTNQLYIQSHHFASVL